MNSIASGSTQKVTRFPSHKTGHNGQNVAGIEHSSVGSSNDVYTPSKLPYTNDSESTGGDQALELQKYIERLDQDRRDMEQRLTEERRLSEERTETRIRDSEQRMETRFDRIEQRFNSMETRFDTTADRVLSLKWWILGVCLATIIAIATMVITVVLA